MLQLNYSSSKTQSFPEEDRVLAEGNNPQTDFEYQCLHQLFAKQVDRDPNAIALICEEQQLTYSQLNFRANQLAHYLKILGLESESLVGLYMERSIDMVVGILGILKAGGAYVPLDVDIPPERKAFILQDAKVSILLTQEHLLSELPEQINQVICVDKDWAVIAQQPSNNLNTYFPPENLAHLVYTSGSTGKPKGVMITHGNLSHYAHALKLAFDITPNDTYLYRGSIALIVSARQLLMPLATGATVVIATAEQKRDPIALFELVKNKDVTIFDHVPSFWRNSFQLLSRLEPKQKKALLNNKVRLVAAGGEQVTLDIAQSWQKEFNQNVTFANIYGQTEGTGVVTVYCLPQKIDDCWKSIPVGYPLPNMQTYILDENLKPVPVGVVGELHISGAGVAKGYLNRPELTAEKFIANPYIKGDRLYKTGDLCRYLPDGSIQFLGRIDHQVNINGLRIELGEIEAVVAQHSAVQETVVVACKHNLNQILVAYLIPNELNPPQTEELRSFLQQKLPSYMLPSRFIFLDTFPLTTSGKIDRRALPKPNFNSSILDKDLIAPSNPYEQKIAEILTRILDIDKIDVRDNFLELGGNSLLAARLVTELEQEYGQKISVATVFQALTIENLAKIIQQNKAITEFKNLIPIKVGNYGINLFAIHHLGHGLEYYRPLSQYLGADISLYGLSSQLSSDRHTPHPRDIEALATYYLKDIQDFQPEGPYFLLGVSFGGVIAYEIAQKLQSQGQEVSLLGLLDTYCPNNQNSPHQKLSLHQRIPRHCHNIKQFGLVYILEKIQTKIQIKKDEMLAILSQFKWLHPYLGEHLDQGYARAKYQQLRREHQQVNRNYSMQVYPGRITLFRATKDSDPKLNWQQFTKQELEIFDIPGDHLAILQEPHVQILAEKVKFCLERDN